VEQPRGLVVEVGVGVGVAVDVYVAVGVVIEDVIVTESVTVVTQHDEVVAV